MIAFKGTGTALITPFIDEEIDFSAYSQHVEYNINGGVEFLVPLGSTGEALTLNEQEQRSILDHVIRITNKRVPIVAGNFGGSDTRAQVAKIKGYNYDGIDAILISSPAYSKPTQAGIYQHYRYLLDASPVPVILYNVPGRTASNVLPETVARLAMNYSHLVAIKEASGELDQINKLIECLPGHCSILSGDDPTAQKSIELGAHGVISVISNLYPRTTSDMIRAALRKDHVKATELNQAMEDLHHWLYTEGNPSGIKAACAHRSGFSESLRLPLVPVSTATRIEITKHVDGQGLS